MKSKETLPPLLLIVDNWKREEDSPIGSFYTEGSLSKFLISHDSKKYLFKETWTRKRNGYFSEEKHQFWSEVIAAKVGIILGLNVPKTYIGIN